MTDVGRRPASVPVDQGSLAWKYSLGRGAWRGLAWNAGVTYSGMAYPNSTAALTDARRYINAPSYYLINTGLTYAWTAGQSRLKQSVRLSAKNLLDRDYEDQKGNLGTRRGVFLAYTIGR